MNSHHSLNDEKQALLERMQASRAAYRRMLSGQEEIEMSVTEELPANTFPKSKTVRWIRDHPYLTLLGLTGVVLATRRGPRQAARSLVTRGSHAATTFSRNQQAIRSAIGIAAMLARTIAQRRLR